MAKILRLWDIMDDIDLKLDLNLLYKRPRVDYRISEYVFEYINKTILEPKKIMDTGNYEICLAFSFYDKNIYKYFDDNVYNTDDTKYSLTPISSMTKNGIKYKCIWIGCYSIKNNEKIVPKEYASISYDMIGAFLVNKFKKITKEIMDNNKNGMDMNFIEKFEFPAFFENQKYLADDEDVRYNDGEKLIAVDIKGEYKKYYKE